MFGNLSKVRLIALLAVVLVVVASATALTASNTVPNIAAGEGSKETVSGYTIANFVFNHNTDDANSIDSVAFGVTPVASGPDAETVSIKLVTTPGASWYDCVAPTPPAPWTCSTTGLTAKDVGTLDIVASGAANAVP